MQLQRFLKCKILGNVLYSSRRRFGDVRAFESHQADEEGVEDVGRGGSGGRRMKDFGGGRGWKTLDGLEPKLYGHRGEKVLLPQHTIPGYKISGILGADFVEPDVCLTKDFVLVCHHNLDLGESTNIESIPELYGLRRNDSKWYIQDLSLAEIKMLRLKQERVGVRVRDFDGLFSIPTFGEFLQAIHEVNYKMKKSVGIIPELKSPMIQNEKAGRGRNFMETELLEELRRFGYALLGNETENCKYKEEGIKCPRVIIQSFESGALEFLRGRTTLELMMLVMDDYRWITRDFLGKRLPKIAHHLGIWKSYLSVPGEDVLTDFGVVWNDTEVGRLGGFANSSEYGRILHGNKMKLSVFTLYDSREPTHFRCGKSGDCGKKEELEFLFQYGVDGMFVENVVEAREGLREFGRRECPGSGGMAAAAGGWRSYLILFSLIGVCIKGF